MKNKAYTYPHNNPEITIGDYKRLIRRMNSVKKMEFYIDIEKKIEKSNDSRFIFEAGVLLKWMKGKKLIPKCIS